MRAIYTYTEIGSFDSDGPVGDASHADDRPGHQQTHGDGSTGRGTAGDGV